MSPTARIVMWIVFALGALVLAAISWGSWMFFKRPLTVDAHMSRFALGKSGLELATLDAAAGPMGYWEGGSGPAMVLLHGAGDQAGAWARVVPELMTSYRLLIPDLPGHWKSAPVEGPIHVPEILGGVEALMDARAGDEPAILVGNSMGAWMAMLYARAHPERVVRVVAVNGGALSQLDSRVNLFPATRDEARATMKALLGPNTPVPPGFVLDDVVRHARSGPAARFAATADEMGAWVLDGRLHELTVPVELVWGTADQLMTMAYAQRMLAELPQARLTPIEDCGHVPQRECPYETLGALKRALGPPPLDETATANDAEEAP